MTTTTEEAAPAAETGLLRASRTLLVAMSLLWAFSVYASVDGLGVPQPEKEPMSLREESARSGVFGHRARYFVGGGPHGGK